MTMRIGGDKTLIQQGAVKKTRQQQQDGTKTGKAKTTDTVSFSALLQQVGQNKNVATSAPTTAVDGLSAPLSHNITYVQDAAEIQESQRADKIEQLKLQIADGSYQPDLKKVAASLVTFIAEGRQV